MGRLSRGSRPPDRTPVRRLSPGKPFLGERRRFPRLAHEIMTVVSLVTARALPA
ncbi:hypothetical protein JCM15519_19190 [Fundidesulfovibrio butyratiphilus]